MTIAAILQGKGHEIVGVDADTTVRDAVALLAEKRIGAVPVMQGGKVAGIMSERDVIYCLKSDGAAVLDWPVSRVMTAPAELGFLPLAAAGAAGCLAWLGTIYLVRHPVRHEVTAVLEAARANLRPRLGFGR